MTKLRIVFVGKDGIYTTEPLRAAAPQHELVGIVESAPRSYGSAKSGGPFESRISRLVDRRNSDDNLRTIAALQSVPIFTLTRENLDDMVEFLRKLHPDVVCIASMSQLMPPMALAIPRLGMINVHPSVLPKYRGPNPWFWQAYHAERQGGVTILRVDEKSDTGNILQQDTFDVPDGTTFNELLPQISQMAARLIPLALQDLIEGKPGRAQKDLPCPFYARRIKLNEELVDWDSWPIERTWHVLRGTDRWIRAIPQAPGLGRWFRWDIGGFSRENVQEKPGAIGKDREGWFVAHRDGKIRLMIDYSPFDAVLSKSIARKKQARLPAVTARWFKAGSN